MADAQVRQSKRPGRNFGDDGYIEKLRQCRSDGGGLHGGGRARFVLDKLQLCLYFYIYCSFPYLCLKNYIYFLVHIVILLSVLFFFLVLLTYRTILIFIFKI